MCNKATYSVVFGGVVVLSVEGSGGVTPGSLFSTVGDTGVDMLGVGVLDEAGGMSVATGLGSFADPGLSTALLTVLGFGLSLSNALLTTK